MTSPRNDPVLRRIAVPDPAVGTEWTITPTDGGVWLVISVVAHLLTSAVVATRAATLRVDDGSDTYLVTAASATQAASLDRAYGAYPGSTGGPAVGSVVPVGWPSDGLILPQGHRLRSVVELIDAGDQWSDVVALVASYPDRPPVLLVPAGGVKPYERMS